MGPCAPLDDVPDGLPWQAPSQGYFPNGQTPDVVHGTDHADLDFVELGPAVGDASAGVGGALFLFAGLKVFHDGSTQRVRAGLVGQGEATLAWLRGKAWVWAADSWAVRGPVVQDVRCRFFLHQPNLVGDEGQCSERQAGGDEVESGWDAVADKRGDGEAHEGEDPEDKIKRIHT